MKLLRSLRAWLFIIIGTGGCRDATTGDPPPNQFEAPLRGENVVPPVSTAATGAAHFFLEGDRLYFAISVSGLNAADSARLYAASAGQNGSAQRTFCGPCASNGGMLAAGAMYAPDSLVTKIRSFGTYVEIRSGGAAMLRGQLRVADF